MSYQAREHLSKSKRASYTSLIAIGAATMVLGMGMATAQAAPIYANEVTAIFRGDATIGNFPGYYGGSFPGSYPVALTEDQAKSAVLGAPDGQFLSLPGNEAADPTPWGSAFQWAYVEVSFPIDFDSTYDLVLTELGDNGESAQLFIWFANGGNLQPVVTRGAGDEITVDLSPYAAILASNGGYFTRVGIGGQDLFGPSQGFDLDAVAISSVPLPAAVWLFASGLLGLIGFARKKK